MKGDQMIKKYKWFAIGGLLVALAVDYVVCDRPSLTDKINYWRGQYEEQKKVAMADAQIKLATIAELEGQNELLQSSIDSANTVIVGLEEAQGDRDTAIGHLTTALGQAKTDAERVPILTAMVEEWKGKFTLAQSEIGELKGQVFNLKTQYQNQIRISENYSGLWTQEKTLRMKAETGLNLQDKRISSLQKQAKLTRIVALVAIVATYILKK
jgi:hypothetical protein